MKPITHVTLIFFITLATSCSILKHEDPEKNVRAFLSSVQASLTKTDAEILENFHVKQSPEALKTAISILQNKDPFIVCDAFITSAQLMFEEDRVKVEIPISLHVKDLDSNEVDSFTLVMWLTKKDDSYEITQFDGEPFYQRFSKLKNQNEWEAHRVLALRDRAQIYEQAIQLQGQYDSVIWHTTYNEVDYFYVSDKNWINYFYNYGTNNLTNTSLMGLVNVKGEVIIPMEYALIGTPGFVDENLVEVTKDGKVGFFNIITKQLVVAPIYDLIIPYEGENVWAVVKQDSIYGSLDFQLRYSAGFTSDKMRDWMYHADFLKKGINIRSGYYSFCEIPAAQYAGYGIIMPPSYYSKFGIFPAIKGGFSTTEEPMGGWTEYIETTGSFLENISDQILAVVVTFRERYLEGREEFYDNSKIMFVNSKLDTLGTANIDGTKLSLHRIDSTLLEVRAPHDYWFMEEDACQEFNLNQHSYFSISGLNSIKALASNRLYPQTQYVKLDSSYLMGNFEVYDPDTQVNVSTTFLSEKTITYMRDEILAENGYRPEEFEGRDYFGYLRKESDPWFTRDEAESAMSPIDRHNLDFLNKILELMKTKPA